MWDALAESGFYDTQTQRFLRRLADYVFRQTAPCGDAQEWLAVCMDAAPRTVRESANTTVRSIIQDSDP